MKHLHVLTLPCLMAALLLSGCSQKGADAYVGEQITSLKEKDTPKYSDEITTTIEVKKKGDNFSIDRKSLRALLDQALLNDMEPYNSLCELYDAKDFLTAYLDASFKGEVTQFAKHTNRTEEEALS